MVTIEIPEELAAKIRSKIGNEPVEEFVLNLVRRKVESCCGGCHSQPTANESMPAEQSKTAYSEEDEEKVKERLKSLGYLD